MRDPAGLDRRTPHRSPCMRASETVAADKLYVGRPPSPRPNAIGLMSFSVYNARMSIREPIAQAAAVPYRLAEGVPEFCLITSVRKGRWGFPKGMIDPGDTPKQTALKEAEEEAGLLGQIEGKSIGEYEYRKWGSDLLVTAYLMQVAEAAEDWEEADFRERRWCSAEKARKLLDREPLLALLDAALERLDHSEVPTGGRPN